MLKKVLKHFPGYLTTSGQFVFTLLCIFQYILNSLQGSICLFIFKSIYFLPILLYLNRRPNPVERRFWTLSSLNSLSSTRPTSVESSSSGESGTAFVILIDVLNSVSSSGSTWPGSFAFRIAPCPSRIP